MKFAKIKKTNIFNRNYKAAFLAGFLGGNIASFVKSGVEVFFPARLTDRVAPPIQLINDLGFQAKDMIYSFSNHILNWGGLGIHHLFSLCFSIFYCGIAEIFPLVKLWQGLAFALFITVLFHVIILPLCGWSPAVWHLPGDEIFSESLGHVAWMWTIEIFRRDIRNRMTGKTDPEFQ